MNFFTHDLSRAGPFDPLTKGGVLHAIAGTLIMITHRDHLDGAVGDRLCGVPDRGRWSGVAAGPDRGGVDDGAAVDRGRPVHPGHVHLVPGVPPVGAGGSVGDQRDDAADHRPGVGGGAAGGPERAAGGQPGARRVAVADGVAGGAADGASGPDHRGDPGHRPRARRDVAGAADGRLHDVPEPGPDRRVRWCRCRC